MENFLPELGGDFAFVGRQRRLRVGDEWYRVDLLFFHRRLRCLVVIDLKLGNPTHADAGQMHLYLNYAREHWTNPGENPPVGLILCAQRDAAVAHYALEGLPNKVLAAEYRTALPDEEVLAAEVERTRKYLERRAGAEGGSKMKCVACGSTALVEGILRGDDGSTPSFYPSDTPLLRRIFAIGGRAVRAYGCVHCQHLQLAIEFREGDLERYQQFEGEQPGVLERISSESGELEG